MAAHAACGDGEAGGVEVQAAGRKMRDSLMRNADCPTMEQFLGRLEEEYAGISSREGGSLLQFNVLHMLIPMNE